MVDDRLDFDKFPALDRAEWWAVFPAGPNMALRFGPFDGPAIGKIMTRCLDEKIPLTIVANCGTEVDWNSARACAETTQALREAWETEKLK